MNHRRWSRFLIAAALALPPVLTSAFEQAGTAPSPAVAPSSPQGVTAGDWIQLFNGRDLTDWTIKFAKHDVGENLNDTFRAEDGLLKVRYDKWPAFNGEFGHIFYRQAFAYYLLAAEYRFVGNQVTGGPIISHCDRRHSRARIYPVAQRHCRHRIRIRNSGGHRHCLVRCRQNGEVFHVINGWRRIRRVAAVQLPRRSKIFRDAHGTRAFQPASTQP